MLDINMKEESVNLALVRERERERNRFVPFIKKKKFKKNYTFYLFPKP